MSDGINAVIVLSFLIALVIGMIRISGNNTGFEEEITSLDIEIRLGDAGELPIIYLEKSEFIEKALEIGFIVRDTTLITPRIYYIFTDTMVWGYII